MSVRIDLPSGARFGPGKAALLRALLSTGSIRSAAEQLGMSYPRALKLIDQMNESFSLPIVTTQHGGATGGGAQITPLGQSILDAYDRICATASTANAEDLKVFQTNLAK
ncbi:MAG: winged helix-turn-helix domain-containing protein [Henriciella sp.]